ncbi:ABC transporter permease [Desulfosporosinus sp. SYSU MS00001]|uniref:ABC transporter permease n=1 Tax=Desulfosporosinus sp. SYSU MS00001 TaxID=3416284 RepID=UPI003CF34C0C
MNHKLRILVEKELVEASRNRLIFGFGIIFFGLSLAMSIFSVISPGATDIQVSRVGVSMLNLATLLVPLISLIISSQGFAAEFEDGTMDLMLTQPLHLRQICLGRILGEWLAVAAALLIGYGASGAVLMLLSSGHQVLPFIINVIISLALSLVFITLGTLISIKAKNRMVALFGALALWFLMIILYDLIVVQILMLTTGTTTMALLYGILILNPADLLRILAIRLTQMKELFGPSQEAMSALPGFHGPVLALLGWAVWIIAIYFWTIRSLRKRVYSRIL